MHAQAHSSLLHLTEKQNINSITRNPKQSRAKLPLKRARRVNLGQTDTKTFEYVDASSITTAADWKQAAENVV